MPRPRHRDRIKVINQVIAFRLSAEDRMTLEATLDALEEATGKRPTAGAYLRGLLRHDARSRMEALAKQGKRKP